jgi:NAD-dependent DNA ligase
MNLRTITEPTSCPTCNSILELVNDQLFCRNNDCEAKTSKLIEHFAKTLKIKGLGPKTIDKLPLNSISDIYSISKNEISSEIGEKLGTKLYEQIEKSKSVDAKTLLPAFSISLIGNTASKRLFSKISHMNDINEKSCVSAGLGPKSCANLLDWYYSDYKDNLEYLPFSFQAGVQEPTAESIGKSVCITGKLNDFKNRTLAKDYMESLGFTVTSSVTKKTDYLVDEEGRKSSKSTKAESYGIPILTIKDILKENLL